MRIATVVLEGSAQAVPIDLNDYRHVRLRVQGDNVRTIWVGATEEVANSTSNWRFASATPDPADLSMTQFFNLDGWPARIWIRATGGTATARCLMWGEN